MQTIRLISWRPFLRATSICEWLRLGGQSHLILEVCDVPTSMWVFSHILCLYVTNNMQKLVVFLSKNGNFGQKHKIQTRILLTNFGSWTDSLLLLKITERKPITCRGLRVNKISRDWMLALDARYRICWLILLNTLCIVRRHILLLIS
jgi:hypothetical protein